MQKPFRSLKNWLTVIALFAVSFKATATQPNVIFLLSDDQSWNDYSFMGHPHIKTPNIDQLAASGILYERGYVTAPLCRPSLASLATGLYPHQTGIRGNDPILPTGKNRNTDKELWIKKRKKMTAPMAKHASFIKILKENGYATLQTGKWWEGNPLDHGFTDAMTHGDPNRGGRHGDVGLKIGRDTQKPIFNFITKAKENSQPFFVWYGVFLPHTPHNAPDRLYHKYKDIAPNEPTARYWANVEWLDETCGEIVDFLKEEGLYENTIFVYTCDNGWVQDPKKKNRYIRSKREPVEAGIRTPIFITHEGQIKPLRDKETLASNIDVATTILHACDIKPPEIMTGLDLRKPEQLKKRNRVFANAYEHDSNIEELDDINSGLKAHVIIDGWDKLIARPESSELYNLKNDPDDRHDLAAENPKKVEELSKQIKKWLQATPPRH